ncbi:MAG: lysophospholipid acyltransferase family protein, partial [Endomicrobiia bacterium]
ILCISKKVWLNTGITVFEFVRSQKLNKKIIMNYVKFENEEFLKEAISYKKGVLLLTCHLGNWELMGISLSLKGYPIMVIARRIKNKLVDKEINRIRGLSGEKVVPEHSAVKESLRWLNRMGCIGILIDQHITEGGVVVDFLGRPAATSPIVALLAKKTGAKVLPLYNIRLPEGKIKIIFEKSFEVNPLADTSEETEKMNKIIGEWIKKYPEQWFWLHNRWKV